jgi:hypothetical protein
MDLTSHLIAGALAVISMIAFLVWVPHTFPLWVSTCLVIWAGFKGAIYRVPDRCCCKR